MQYLDKDSLENIRAGITSMAPQTDIDWKSKIFEATKIILTDLKYSWWPQICINKGLGTAVFDQSRLLAGWDYTSLDTCTQLIAGQRVKVMPEHTAGGNASSVYKVISITPVIVPALWNTDFSDTAVFEDVTEQLTDDISNLIAYKALYLIYRYLAADQEKMNTFAEQRDYFEALYEREWLMMQKRGLPRYDFDDSKTFTAEETVVTGPSVVLSVTW